MPVSRLELTLILAITFTGLAARFAIPGDLAVEHFDEGVYASNLWFPDDGYQYPDRFLYAPPLLPSLVEWSMIICGPQSWAPFLPALVLGTLTVPLAWWSVRRWTNPAVGVAAAALLALNDFHIVMSRSVLTDAPMVFFLLFAVWLIVEALAKADLRLAAIAGLATGCCWATKYNGWLPLAIAISGGAAAWMFYPKANGKRPSFVLPVVVMLLAAGLTWLPVWWDLQSIGGYSRVADNHRNYFTGVAGWWSGALRHEAVQRHYAGWPTLLSGWVAVIAAGLLIRVERSTWNESDRSNKGATQRVTSTARDGVKRSTWNDHGDSKAASKSALPSAGQASDKSASERSTWNEAGDSTRGAGSRNTSQFAVTLGIAGSLSGAIVLSPLAAFGVWSLTELGAMIVALKLRLQHQRNSLADGETKKVRKTDSGRKNEDSNPRKSQEIGRWMGAWLHLAWLCGLLLTTPLYRPYPRLVLPLLTVACLATGSAIVRLLTGRLVTGQIQSSHDIDSRAKAPSSANPDAAGRAEESTADRNFARQRRRFFWLVPVVALCFWRAANSDGTTWQHRTGLDEIAEQAVAEAHRQVSTEARQHDAVDFIIYVYGEPGLFFHIPRDGVPVQPVMDLNFARPGSGHPRVPTFVLAGPHAWKSPQFGEQLREVDAFIDLVKVFPYRPSDFVLLDDHAPRLLSRNRKEDVRLFRVRFE